MSTCQEAGLAGQPFYYHVRDKRFFFWSEILQITLNHFYFPVFEFVVTNKKKMEIKLILKILNNKEILTTTHA